MPNSLESPYVILFIELMNLASVTIFFLILACLWTFFSKHVVVECRVEPQGCVPFSLHKCFKWWWLAIPEKHTITKPLINSNFNLRQPKGLTYRG